MWNPDIVLNHIEKLGVNKKMSLIELSKKITILMLLLSGQRGQTIQALNLKNMKVEKDQISFYNEKLMKTSRPGRHKTTVTFRAYPHNKKLCIVTALKVYVRRTDEIRGSSTQLLVTTTKPTRPATIDTVRRWVKNLMQEAGIDVEIFKSHSTRGASMSKAVNYVDTRIILKTAGWRKESTFGRFYKKPILEEDLMTNAILSRN